MSTFVVSVGRFAFADPPEWVTPDVSVMLEHTNGKIFRIQIWSLLTYHPSDLAAILLEFVTMSPDLDLVWKVYQKRGNEGNHKHVEENEDEREARLAHPVPEDEWYGNFYNIAPWIITFLFYDTHYATWYV